MSKNYKDKKSRTPHPSSSSPIKSSPFKHKKTYSLAGSFKKIIENISKPTLNIEEIEDTSDSPVKQFDNVSAKARKLKYSIQEWILMKSIIFSLVVFLIFVILLHFVLNLAGGYLPVLILSVLTSIALRPTKDAFSSSIKELFGITQSQNQEKFFFRQSLIFLIYKTINDLIHYKKNASLSKKRRQKIGAMWKQFSLTGDIYAILIICSFWFLISKFGINIVLYVFGIILVGDLVLKLLMDSLALFMNQFSCIRKIKHNIQKNKSFSVAIDSTVATSVLILFLVFSVGCLIFMLFFLLGDLETIFVNLSNSITALIQNINQKVSEYSGIENAIDEDFVLNFIKNYNESISSYVGNQDFKGAYLLFSGIYSYLLLV